MFGIQIHNKQYLNWQTALVCLYLYHYNELLNGRVCFNLEKTKSQTEFFPLKVHG